MKTNKLMRATMLASAASACIAAVTPALAQEAEAGADVIIVTGSRIARQEIDAPIPVAVVNAESIKQSGASNIQDILNELPQVGIGTSRTNSNFSTVGNGVATVDPSQHGRIAHSGAGQRSPLRCRSRR
jgi:iron complex outermembrane receptor protein